MTDTHRSASRLRNFRFAQTSQQEGFCHGEQEDYRQRQGFKHGFVCTCCGLSQELNAVVE